MGVAEDLAECVGVSPDSVDLSALFGLVDSFLVLAVDMIVVPALVLRIPDFTSLDAVIGIIVDPLAPPDFPEGSFDPEVIIGFAKGLAGIALGLPALFDLPAITIEDGELVLPKIPDDFIPPPFPTPPGLPDLAALIKVSFALDTTGLALPIGFDVAFATCIATSFGIL